MSISMIWAMDRNHLIGKNNQLPWHIPRDTAFFIEKTRDKTVLMGRKTWESLGSKPLKDRRNVVLTRDRQFTCEGCTVVHTLEEALQLDEGKEELMVIGGAEIYKLMLPYADQLIITWIDAEFEGDAYFPEIPWEEWKEVSSIPGIRDEKNPYDYRFAYYERTDS